MKRMIIAVAILGAMLGTQASAAAESGPPPAAHARKAHAPRSSSSTVIYNRDSSDPRVGWHTVNGLRQCTQDCDNPEIPGSGYTCRNVQVLGMAMRECTWSSR